MLPGMFCCMNPGNKHLNIMNVAKENMKKRMTSIGEVHSSRNHVASGSQEQEELTLPLQSKTSKEYKAMTVKELKEEIKSKGLKVKGVAKMKKYQLIEVLLQSCENA